MERHAGSKESATPVEPEAFSPMPAALGDDCLQERLTYSPAPIDRRQTLLELATEEIHALGYLEVVGESVMDGQREMVRLDVTTSRDVPIEAVQADVRRIWKTKIAGRRTSLHVFRVTRTGFDFRFSLLDQGLFVTGIISFTFEH